MSGITGPSAQVAPERHPVQPSDSRASRSGQCRCLPATPRCSLASLLTIALHGKLEYYTGIMKELLVDLIDASAAKNPKLMLRRTESVVEKMLTNWMSICMYSCLRETRQTQGQLRLSQAEHKVLPSGVPS
ncbi:hypothetical protein MC885_004882 [Smutsia gigantea]|nr:hypothetical protein MC885_004882 [Smutsia gigantea]